MAGNFEVYGLKLVIDGGSSGVEGAASKAVASLRMVEKQAQRVNESVNFSAIRYGMDQFARLGAPVTNALGRGAQAALSFEDAMGVVKTSMDPETFAKADKKIRDMARTMAVDFPKEGPEGIAIAMSELAKAGVDPLAKEFDQILRPALGLATVESSGFGQTIATVLGITQNFTGGIERAGEVMHKLMAASLASTADVKTLREAFKMAAPSAKLFGISIEDLLTDLSLLHQAGLRGSQAGTSYGRLLDSLVKDVDKPTSNLKRLAMLSGDDVVQLTDSTGKMRSLWAIMGDIRKSLPKVKDEAERAAIAMALLQIRGARGFSALGSIAATERDRIMKLVQSGAVDQVATRQGLARFDTAAGGIERVTSSAKGLATSIFDSLFGGRFSSGAQGMARDIRGIGDAFTALYRDSMDSGEAVDKFGRSTVGMAQSIRAALGGAEVAFRIVTAPIQGFVTTMGFLNENVPYIGSVLGGLTGVVFGLGTAFVALGTVFGIMGLAWRGWQQMALFVNTQLGRTTTTQAQLNRQLTVAIPLEQMTADKIGLIAQRAREATTALQGMNGAAGSTSIAGTAQAAASSVGTFGRIAGTVGRFLGGLTVAGTALFTLTGVVDLVSSLFRNKAKELTPEDLLKKAVEATNSRVVQNEKGLIARQYTGDVAGAEKRSQGRWVWNQASQRWERPDEAFVTPEGMTYRTSKGKFTGGEDFVNNRLRDVAGTVQSVLSEVVGEDKVVGGILQPSRREELFSSLPQGLAGSSMDRVLEANQAGPGYRSQILEAQQVQPVAAIWASVEKTAEAMLKAGKNLEEIKGQVVGMTEDARYGGKAAPQIIVEILERLVEALAKGKTTEVSLKQTKNKICGRNAVAVLTDTIMDIRERAGQGANAWQRGEIRSGSPRGFPSMAVG